MCGFTHFSLKTWENLTFSEWLKRDQWPELGFINGCENLKWSATRPFWQNHLGFNSHRKPLQFSSRGPCQKTHLGFPKNLSNFQCTIKHLFQLILIWVWNKEEIYIFNIKFKVSGSLLPGSVVQFFAPPSFSMFLRNWGAKNWNTLT